MKKLALASCLLIVSGSVMAELPYNNIVVKYAGKYGFDPLLVHAQIKQESGHRVGICSHAGACGLMQLMPATAQGLGVRNRADPDQNVEGGVRFMRSLLAQFGGNYVNAFRAYNWGPGNMRSYLKGKKKFMPAEAVNYPIAIRKHYYSYGGKGSFFENISNGNTPTEKKQQIANNKKVNPNTQKQLAKLNSGRTCQPIKLPPQQKISFENIPALGTMPNPSGSGKVVFDPARHAYNVVKAAEIVQQLQNMKAQYQSLTKGAAGLNLLQDITQLAGFELPQKLPSGFNTPSIFQNKEGKKNDSVYSTLAEQRAADTGVYGNEQLKTSYREAAKIANHAYVEAEMAWTQVNCSITNINALEQANNSTDTRKASRDVANRIALEKAMLEANAAKLKASLAMLNATVNNYSLEIVQAQRQYTKNKDRK